MKQCAILTLQGLGNCTYSPLSHSGDNLKIKLQYWETPRAPAQNHNNNTIISYVQVTKLSSPTLCLLVTQSVAHICPCSITHSHLSFIQHDCMFWINMFGSYNDWSWLRLFSVYKCSLSIRDLDTPASAAFSHISWPRKRRSSPSCCSFILYNVKDQKQKSYSDRQVLQTHNIWCPCKYRIHTIVQQGVTRPVSAGRLLFFLPPPLPPHFSLSRTSCSRAKGQYQRTWSQNFRGTSMSENDLDVHSCCVSGRKAAGWKGWIRRHGKKLVGWC